MATVRATVRQTVVFIEVYEVEVEGEVTADSISEAAVDGWPDAIQRISSNVVDEEVTSWRVLTEAEAWAAAVSDVLDEEVAGG